MILQYLLLMLFVPVATFTLAYAVARLTGKVTFLDAAWGVGYVLIAWVSFFAFSTKDLPNLLLSLAVSLWGLRLAWYVVGRIAKTGEDKRYQEILRGYGENAQAKAFSRLFMLQAGLQYIVSAAILRMNYTDPKPAGIATGWVWEFSRLAFSSKLWQTRNWLPSSATPVTKERSCNPGYGKPAGIPTTLARAWYGWGWQS